MRKRLTVHRVGPGVSPMKPGKGQYFEYDGSPVAIRVALNG